MDDTIVRLMFGRDGNADTQIGPGWSPPEPGFRWMIDDVSQFWLDNPAGGPCTLEIDLRPFVRQPQLPKQHVTIEIGATEVYKADLAKPATCTIPVPAASSQESRIDVTIRHPDARSPRDLIGGTDTRKLALAVSEARLRPANDPAAPAVIAEPARQSTVFYGNCQMRALAALYRRMLPAGSDHTVIHVPPHKEGLEENRHAIAHASVLLRQVLNSNAHGGDLPTSTRQVLVPHVCGAFLWPYSGSRHPLNQPEPLVDPAGPYNAQNGDSFLNRLIAAGTAPVSAVAHYLAAEDQVVRRAERMMELHMQAQRERDAICDIPVAAHIEAHVRTQNLFRSADHLEPVMASWLARAVFSRMGADPAAIDRLVAALPDEYPPTETSIHPAIARHFGLTYAPPERGYRFLDEGRFNFVESTRRYMQYEWNPLLAEGLALFRQKKTNLAVIKLEAAVALSRRSAVGRIALAQALAQTNRLNHAVEYAYQAVEIEPANQSYISLLLQFEDGLRRPAMPPALAD